MMTTRLLKTPAFLALFLMSTVAWAAEDCGWNQLTASEQEQLQTQPLMKADWRGSNGTWRPGKSHYRVKNWGLIDAPSVAQAVALYYDFESGAVPDASLVDTIVRAGGEEPRNNPAKFDLRPADHNPYGDLYLPFSFTLSVRAQVRPEQSAYVLRYETLTSLGLIDSIKTDICVTKQAGKILVHWDAFFVGSKLDFTFKTPAQPGRPSVGLSKQDRLNIWAYTFGSVLKKMSGKATDAQMENLRSALLGNFDY